MSSRRSETAELWPTELPASPNTLIGAEVNFHSPTQPQRAGEKRPRSVWMGHPKEHDSVKQERQDQDLPQYGKQMKPDVTIAHRCPDQKISWTAMADPRGSNHHPIVCKLQFNPDSVRKNPIIRFAILRGNCPAFKLALRKDLKRDVPLKNATKRSLWGLSWSSTTSCKKNITYGCSCSTKEWFSPEGKDALRNRKIAHRQLKKDPNNPLELKIREKSCKKVKKS